MIRSESVPSPEARCSRLEVEALVRVDDHERAASAAVRALIHTVAEWEPGTELAVTVASHRGRMVLRLDQRGTPQPGWEDDVRWCLRPIARLRRASASRATGTPDWSSICELVPSRGLAEGAGIEADPWSPGEAYDVAVRRIRRHSHWPQPHLDALGDLCRLLDEHGGLLLRMRLAPATPIEVAMVTERFIAGLDGLPADPAAYLGRPIRVRTLLGSTSGPLPARFRSLARRLATSLELAEVPVERAASAWDGPPSALAGHAVPEGLALALVRLPVTGAGDRAITGFRSVHPPVPARPLDPVPRAPAVPIRLGLARTAAGRSVAAVLGVDDLARHGLIEGTTGAGKSTLIAAIIREATRAGYGCTFLDPHGTTIDQVLSELPEGSERTYVVRHADEGAVVPLNIFTGSTPQVERSIEAFAELVQEMYDPGNEGIVGPRWRRWFGLIALATHHALGEQASLVAVTEIGSDPARVKRLADMLGPTHPQIAKSIVDEIVNDRSNEVASVLAWCIAKLHPLIATGTTRSILGSGADAVDVASFMDEGKTLLVDLASPGLGQPQARLLGALWLMKHQQAMGARNAHERPHLLIVDEAGLLQFGALPAILSEGRKFGLGAFVVVQHVGQLRQSLAESVETNAGTFVTLRTGVSHAARSSVRLGGWPVGEIVRLPNLTAAATIGRNGTMTEPFTLVIDHHRRMERQRARGPAAAERAAEVVSRSAIELVSPHADRPVADAALLDELLRRGTGRGADATGPRAPDPRLWSVKLVEVKADGGERMRLIRAVRAACEVSLAVAADVVDSPPSYVVRGVAREVADDVVRQLGPLGAVLVLEDEPQLPAAGPGRSSSFLDEWLAKRKVNAGTKATEEEGDDDQS